MWLVIWWVFDLLLTKIVLDLAGLATLFWIGVVIGLVSLAFRRG